MLVKGLMFRELNFLSRGLLLQVRLSLIYVLVMGAVSVSKLSSINICAAAIILE